MRRIQRTLPLVTLIFGLAACGGDSAPKSDGVASLGGTTTTTEPAASGRGSGGPGGGIARVGGDDDSFYAFAKCMRDRGVNVPDPEPNGAVKIEPGSEMDPGNPKFQEAQKACGKELGDMAPGGADPARRQEFQDKALAFARCMRENGIDMPDPSFGEGGTIEQPIAGSLSPDDPKFQEAAKRCEPQLPGPGGRVEGPGVMS